MKKKKVEEDINHKPPKKIGWLKKFLAWLSKGAAESRTERMDCPT